MTGKERTADEKRRGTTRELESIRRKRYISRVKWAQYKAAQDIRNGVSNDNDNYLKILDDFGAMDKRKKKQYAGKFGGVHK